MGKVSGATYRHDGHGDLILSGPYAIARMTLEAGRDRFESIETWRGRMAASLPLTEELRNQFIAEADACMSSLLRAVAEAEAYRARWGEPLNATPERLSDRQNNIQALLKENGG